MDRPTFASSVKAKNYSNPQANAKIDEDSKTSRIKRVFGSARSTNIQTKPLTDNKLINKPKFVVPVKPERKNSLKMSSPLPVIDTTKEIKKESVKKKDVPQNVNTVVPKKYEKPLNPETPKIPSKSKEKEHEEPRTPLVSHSKTYTTTTKNIDNPIGVTFEELVKEASDKKEFPENINTGVNKKEEKSLDTETQQASNKSKKKEYEEIQTTPLLVSHSKTTSNTKTNKNKSNNKSKLSPTPFYSAKVCNKCRYDKLETPSYWIDQIKLAESVGKHFVAVDFFRLGFASQAEPIRKLRIELKKYLSSHVSLSEQMVWREVEAMYGLSKPESNTFEADSITENV